MDPSLRSRLERLNVDLADSALEPDRAVWLACDLLLAGVDTPALRELAGESPTRLARRDVHKLVEQMLVELGITPMTAEEADWFLGRETALEILAGAPRDEWEGKTWRITTRVNDEHDGIYAAMGTYDTDPEPFRRFLREYLRLADEQLGAITP